jgi:microsomal dipeptidase-like Zn-dependent dipeptidase
MVQKLGVIAYVGLTHHGENRFGGGNTTTVGLKRDGEILIDHIARFGIAMDLSHASDQMAGDILSYIASKNLDIAIMASHSNLRSIHDTPRNLPSAIAKEIISRRGLIGICFLRSVLGPGSFSAINAQVEEILSLGGGRSLSFGSDFFCERQHPNAQNRPFFHEDLCSARCFPAVINEIRSEFGDKTAMSVAHANAELFFSRVLTKQE